MNDLTYITDKEWADVKQHHYQLHGRGPINECARPICVAAVEDYALRQDVREASELRNSGHICMCFCLGRL